MSAIKLLPRPTWPDLTNVGQEQSYWVKYRCSESCGGHIMPFDRVYETGIFLQPSIIDYKQWGIAREQEFRAHEALVNLSKKKKPYTGRKKPQRDVKIFGK